MTSLCLTIAPALIGLICLSSYGWAEDLSLFNTHKQVFLAARKFDPNVHQILQERDMFYDNNGIHTLDDEDSDAFFRHNRQFYRFGRAFAPLWDNVDDPLVRKNLLAHFSAFPLSPALDDDVFSRNSRQFYRFGRAYPPYQDKRFLRFGRSHQPDIDEYLELLHSDPALYRKRRSQDGDANEDGLQRIARSADANPNSMNTENNKSGKDLQKRETKKEKLNVNEDLEIVSNEDKDLDKRFMRFGKRFMRFGRGDEDESYEKRFMRFGKGDQEFDKRFMRFGKRFMRFGRDAEDDAREEKRFLRFGKSSNEDGDVKKRFMRFGKSGAEEEGVDKRFMRFGKSGAEEEDVDKRFMRFGKRFMRFGKSGNEDGDVDKRFMRFGKRFMRFGRGDSETS